MSNPEVSPPRGEEKAKLVKKRSSRILLKSVVADLGEDLYCPDEDSLEEPVNLKHGLFLCHTLRVKGKIKTVLYYPKDQSFKAIHSDHVYHYSGGKCVQELPLDTECDNLVVEKLIHAVEQNKYIGVCKQTLVLFDSNFHVVHRVECGKTLTTATYNLWSGEVITGGVGHLQVMLARI